MMDRRSNTTPVMSQSSRFSSVQFSQANQASLEPTFYCAAPVPVYRLQLQLL